MNSSGAGVIMQYCARPFAVVVVTEGHAALVEGEPAAVRDGDTVDVAGEIGEHRLGPREGRPGVDEPVLPAQWRKVRTEGLLCRVSDGGPS